MPAKPTKPVKKAVTWRLRRDLLDRLKVMADNWKPQTSVVKLAELACEEFVDRNAGKENAR